MRTTISLRAFCAVFFAALGLASALPAQAHMGEHSAPATASKTDNVQSLDLYRDGQTLHLLIGMQRAGETQTTLWHKRSANGGKTWSRPVRVDAGSAAPFQLNRGGDAQIAAAGDKLIAAWSIAGTGWGGSGPITTAVSADGGMTWQPGPNPADDESTLGHSFIDLIADAGRFHMVWLDGRGNDKQGLRYAQSADGGKHWSANATIADNTCECCWNTLAVGADHRLYTLFRDGSPRDMMLAESADRGAQWTKTSRVGEFNWQIDACPHAGGGLAANPQQPVMHAAVWTGQDDNIGLHYLHSPDGGQTWDHARQLGGKNAKHVDLVMGADGSVMAIWDETANGASAIYKAKSADGGTTWSTPKRVSTPGGSATHPRLVAAGTGFVAAWTQNGKLVVTRFRRGAQ